jgi:hypothetical protein
MDGGNYSRRLPSGGFPACSCIRNAAGPVWPRVLFTEAVPGAAPVLPESPAVLAGHSLIAASSTRLAIPSPLL